MLDRRPAAAPVATTSQRAGAVSIPIRLPPSSRQGEGSGHATHSKGEVRQLPGGSKGAGSRSSPPPLAADLLGDSPPLELSRCHLAEDLRDLGQHLIRSGPPPRLVWP